MKRFVAALVAAIVVLVASPAGAAEHVVQRGEWLWSIARADLRAKGAPFTEHDVHVRADELYALNRDVIGDDPNRLLPGMRLRLDAAPPFSGTYRDARAVALDAEGRAVTAGQFSGAFGLARFRPDGTRDLLVSTRIGDYAGARAVAVQPDGRIVAAGGSNGERGAVRSDVTLARYLPDGTLDPSFGGDGIVTTTVRDYASALDVVVQPDGRIVVAGSAAEDSSGTAVDALLARYLPDGSLDPTFGDGGVVLTDVKGSIDIAEGLALLPDGRLAVGGTSYRETEAAESDFLLAIYGADGALERTTVTDVGSVFDQAHDVALVPGGGFLVAGDAVPGGVTSQAVVVRFDADGDEIDRTVTTALEEAEAVALDDGGRYVLAGRAGGFAKVARLTPDGAVEASWADFGGERSAAFDVELLGPEIVAAGCTCDGANTTYRGGFEIPSEPVVRRYR